MKEGIEVTIRHSKTDQMGRIEFFPLSHMVITLKHVPLEHSTLDLKIRKLKRGCLFRFINRHIHISEKGLCPASIVLIIKRNSYLCGKQTAYSRHSLRAGCTTASAKEIPENAIMRKSRHKKSDTLRKIHPNGLSLEG